MARTRKAGKSAPQQADAPVKVTLYLPDKLAKQFATHAVQTGVSKSDLFAELVKAGCKRFVVSDRQSGPADQGEENAA